MSRENEGFFLFWESEVHLETLHEATLFYQFRHKRISSTTLGFLVLFFSIKLDILKVECLI